MRTSVTAIMNKAIGAGALFLAAVFMSPYSGNGPNPVGIGLGILGVWLVARRERVEESPELEQRLARVEAALASQAEELETARTEIGRLLEDRSFMAALQAGAAARSDAPAYERPS